jgi:hypothetical protein
MTESEPEDGDNIFLLNYGSQRILHGVVITDLQTYKACSSAPEDEVGSSENTGTV